MRPTEDKEAMLTGKERRDIWVCGEGTLEAILKAQIAKLERLGYKKD